MAYNPLRAADNDQPATEFGGLAGHIQPKSPGHRLDADTQGVRQAAFIVRSEGIRRAGVMVDLPETDEHYQAVLDSEADRKQRLGDWSLEDVP